MNRFAVGQQNHTQKLAIGFRYCRPTAYTPIGLNDFSDWVLNHMRYPRQRLKPRSPQRRYQFNFRRNRAHHFLNTVAWIRLTVRDEQAHFFKQPNIFGNG